MVYLVATRNRLELSHTDFPATSSALLSSVLLRGQLGDPYHVIRKHYHPMMLAYSSNHCELVKIQVGSSTVHLLVYICAWKLELEFDQVLQYPCNWFTISQFSLCRHHQRQPGYTWHMGIGIQVSWVQHSARASDVCRSARSTIVMPIQPTSPGSFLDTWCIEASETTWDCLIAAQSELMWWYVADWPCGRCTFNTTIIQFIECQTQSRADQISRQTNKSYVHTSEIRDACLENGWRTNWLCCDLDAHSQQQDWFWGLRFPSRPY